MHLGIILGEGTFTDYLIARSKRRNEMKNIRTDMASEIREEYMKEYAKQHKGEPDGIKYETSEVCGIKTTKISVFNENGEKILGKPIGNYYSMHTGKLWLSDFDKFKCAANELVKIISSLCDVHSPVLVAGLGNRYITADAIGPLAVHNVVVSRHIKEYERAIYDSAGLGDISALVPGVIAQTGMEAAEQIKGAVKMVKPSTVILIDALACRNLSSLAQTVQISDTGICPGSGVGNDRGELSEKIFGVKTVCIGIPTVIDTRTLVRDALENCANMTDERIDSIIDCVYSDKGSYVCPKDCDVAVDEMARLAGYAVNKAFHRSLSYEEMMYM